jgi:protein SCO1/2
MPKIFKNPRRPALLLLAACLLFPAAGQGHAPGPAASSATVGLDERLGSRLPLDLSFRDEAGQPVRLRDLITGPTIILPVYYRCTNVCSFLQQGLASALPAVRRTPGREYRVISLSFDETETPADAARARQQYLTAMTAPFPADGWRFLTGDATAVARVTSAAGFTFSRQGREFLHPVASFVVAGDGTIVRYLYGTTFLPKDLALALLEAKGGRAGTAIRRAVGYCFTFDPAGRTYVFNLLRVSATVVIISLAVFLAVLLLAGKKRPRRSAGRP